MFTNMTPVLELQHKTVKMCLAVPSIMASRIWMLSTTPLNSPVQRKEINRMVTEKQDAFFTSLSEVNSQILSSQLALANQWIRHSHDFLWGNYKSFANFDKSVDSETLKIIDKGITPYAKTVKSNSERLLK